MIIKTLKTTLSVVIFLLMTLLTYWAFLFDRPNLVGGSVGQMMHIASVNAAIPVILLIATGVAMWLYLKKPSAVKLGVCGICFCAWVMSGRMVGVSVFPDGRLSAGWFAFGSDEFYLCDQKTDCETALGYQTKTENLFFWRVRIKNKNADRVIFIGPILWFDALDLFKQDIGTRKYTDKQ